MIFNFKKKDDLITAEEFAEGVRDEVMKVWPRQELIDLLAKYNTSIEHVTLPDMVPYEDLVQFYRLAIHMMSCYGKTAADIMRMLKDKQLDSEVVFNHRCVRRWTTRRKALVLDELLQGLSTYRDNEVEECELPQDLSSETIQKTLNGMGHLLEYGMLNISIVVINCRMMKRRDEILAAMPKRRRR